jgi:hypothetical protein
MKKKANFKMNTKRETVKLSSPPIKGEGFYALLDKMLIMWSKSWNIQMQ